MVDTGEEAICVDVGKTEPIEEKDIVEAICKIKTDIRVEMILYMSEVAVREVIALISAVLERKE